MREAPQHHVEHAENFFDLCLRAAQEFLHTIVVVDDRATYGKIEEVTTLNSPASGSTERGDGDDDQHYFANETGSGSSLDVAALTDASADLGLTCAVLRPQAREQHDGTLDRRLTSAARRADVLVLDWQLNDESDGEAALRLLVDVAADDQRAAARLRLVCIYTSEPNLDRVHDLVQAQLGSVVARCSVPDEDYRWLDCGYMRVVILSKEGNLGIDDASSSVVSEDALPERLLREFTYLTAGLVSNVAVAALAAVRQNAHRLIARFRKDLDPAFLSHRFYEGGGESEELLVRLVADEIKTLLDGADVRRWVSSSAVSLWGESYLPSKVTIPSKKTVRTLDREMLLKVVLSDGHQGPLQVNDAERPAETFDIKKTAKESITAFLVDDPKAGPDLDYDFARLTCVARNDPHPFPGDKSPVLTEGTILRGREGRNSVYLLCAMPLCDSVRIDTARAFPFVPLKDVGPDGSFSIVADTPEEERLYLSFTPKNHYDIVRHTFAGDPSGLVRSKRSQIPRGERFVFYDLNGKPWIWIAELRFQHAHRKLHELGVASSRVGLDESYLLRMAAKRPR